MFVSDRCLGVHGLGGWVRMRGGTTVSITWGCGHTCSWDPCHLCLLLPTSECELKVDVCRFRQRQDLPQELSRLSGGKGGMRRDPKAAWGNCLLLFPFYNFWLGWVKGEINSLTSALRTLPECLSIRAPLIPSLFSEHLWTVVREMHPHSKSFCLVCCF